MESQPLLCIFSLFSQVVEFILPIPLLALITGWPTSQAEPRGSPQPGAGASTDTGAPLRKTPRPLFTGGETEAGAQLADPLGFSSSSLSVFAGNGDFLEGQGDVVVNNPLAASF